MFFTLKEYAHGARLFHGLCPIGRSDHPHHRHAGRYEPGRRHLRGLAPGADGFCGRGRRSTQGTGPLRTIAIEAMRFLKPVYVGDEVSLYATVLHVGRTSMRINVEAWRRSREGEEIEQVTEGVFTFVAIDADRRPRPIDHTPPAS